jgi:hypothetical protein
MTDHCTPSTARALRDSGFKQPPAKPGQFWYYENRLFVIVSILTDTAGQTAILYEISEESRDVPPMPVRLPFSDVFVYAATATEILSDLGEDWALSRVGEDWFCESIYANWLKKKKGAVNVNPVSVCAEIWIAKQKQL